MTYTKMQIQRYMYDIYRQEVKDMQEYRKLQERTNEDLVKEYQTTHNEDLFRALLEKNTGLLHIIVMDYRIPKYEIEDLLSESYIALIKAVDNFDPTRGVTFTTALKVFVRQHLNRLYWNIQERQETLQIRGTRGILT